MFGKKECGRCGEKSSGKSNFCPNCGVPFNGKQEKMRDFGMLGESDIDEKMGFANSIFGGFGGKMMNKMFESAVKMLEKEMQKEIKKSKPKANLQLFVNGKRIDLSNCESGGNLIEESEIPFEKLPNSELKGFSKLEKKEPETNIRRLSNKMIYEVNMPGVNSRKDLSIVKLENSIEIKALAKDKAYKKIIPIGFPIKSYNFSNGKLVLELGIKE